MKMQKNMKYFGISYFSKINHFHYYVHKSDNLKYSSTFIDKYDTEQSSSKQAFTLIRKQRNYRNYRII